MTIPASQSYPTSAAQLCIEQICLDAGSRWLRPVEICVILQNYKKFQVHSKPPNQPLSGSFFLFDRNALPHFRKDGHSWSKNKEGHVQLKDGGVAVLHCYYAHAAENKHFQRRSYWMIEGDLSHMAFVHYLNVKESKKTSIFPSDTNDVFRGWQFDDVSFTEMNGASASYDYEGVHRHQASHGFHFGQELHFPTSQAIVGSVPYHTVPTSSGDQGQISTICGTSLGSITGQRNKSPLDNGSLHQFWQGIASPSCASVVERSDSGYESVNFQRTFACPQSSGESMMTGEQIGLPDHALTRDSGREQEVRSHSFEFKGWQVSNWNFGQNMDDNLDFALNNHCQRSGLPSLNQVTKSNDINHFELSNAAGLQDSYICEPGRQVLQDDLQFRTINTVGYSLESHSNGNLSAEDRTIVLPLKQPLLGGFNHLISQPQTVLPSSPVYMDAVQHEVGDGSFIPTQVPLDNNMLSPLLLPDQLFSILEFSPNWTYSGIRTKVLVVGKFSGSQEGLQEWTCVFGELEVPAEVVADGVLRCYTPPHETGRVSFYVKYSNGLARTRSNLQEFEFRPRQDVDIVNAGSPTSDFYTRFGKLLSLDSSMTQTSLQSNSAETLQLCREIDAMLRDDSEWEQIANRTKQAEYSPDKAKDQVLQKLLKDKLRTWLLQKIVEDGKGPNVLDKDGQGVLHFAASLDYDWAIRPTIAARVSINFRDAKGWTALHWAACNGRERMVVALLSLGAAPGFLTDPSTICPSGQSPADLASSKGHEGIAGFLAESFLVSHLSLLTLNESNMSHGGKSAVTVSEQIAALEEDNDSPHELSLRNCRAAVCNAVEAEACIRQVYRIWSFQREQLKEHGDRRFGISDEEALSLLAAKTGQKGERNRVGVVRIQRKFRNSKGQKGYLLRQQRIIKIQALVRGHQVRQNERRMTIARMMRILEVILRWRGKGGGFRGCATMHAGTREDECEHDFLKVGRKQTEKRMKKALDQVISMSKSPEARNQYHRMRNAFSEMQENRKAALNPNPDNEEADFDEVVIDVDDLLDDMPK